MDHMTVGFHARDETELEVVPNHRDDGSLYFVIRIGQSMNHMNIFATPEFLDRLGAAIVSKVGRMPTEAEAMFIGMVEKELEEEGSCP